jgi:hypothetical protein
VHADENESTAEEASAEEKKSETGGEDDGDSLAAALQELAELERSAATKTFKTKKKKIEFEKMLAKARVRAMLLRSGVHVEFRASFDAFLGSAPGAVNVVRFSPCGRALAVGFGAGAGDTATGMIRIWTRKQDDKSASQSGSAAPAAEPASASTPAAPQEANTVTDSAAVAVTAAGVDEKEDSATTKNELSTVTAESAPESEKAEADAPKAESDSDVVIVRSTPPAATAPSAADAAAGAAAPPAANGNAEPSAFQLAMEEDKDPQHEIWVYQRAYL